MNAIRNLSTKITVAAGLAMASGLSMAQTATGFDAVLDAIDLSGVATKVGALAVVVVGIALVFKAPTLLVVGIGISWRTQRTGTIIMLDCWG